MAYHRAAYDRATPAARRAIIASHRFDRIAAFAFASGDFEESSIASHVANSARRCARLNGESI